MNSSTRSTAVGRLSSMTTAKVRAATMCLAAASSGIPGAVLGRLP
jgi:hypothetical protein